MRNAGLLIALVLGVLFGIGLGVFSSGKKLPSLGSRAAHLQEFSESFNQAAERVIPSVVHITTTTETSGGNDETMFRPPWVRRESRVGSGVVLTPDGYILTNFHVVEGVTEVLVGFSDRREDIGKVVGVDVETDLAVIKVPEHPGLQPAHLGKADRLRIGDWVLAVGNPYGLSHTVTAGIVSAVGRRQGLHFYEDYIQTDAAIFPGNSGGALVNLDGEVVGIVSAVVTEGEQVQNIGFANSMRLSKWVAEQLIRNGEVVRGYLGTQLNPLNHESIQRLLGADNTERVLEMLGLESTNGAFVANVQPGTPADDAGLHRMDVIVEFGSQPVHSVQELVYMVAGVEPGKEIVLGVVRAGERMEVPIVIGRRPKARTQR